MKPQQYAYSKHGRHKLRQNPLILAALFIVMVSCENDLDKIRSLNVAENLPSEVVKDAVVLYSDGGVTRARLTAPLMEHYTEQGSYVELTEGINLVFYDEWGEITSHLTANYAINYEKEEKMEARGDVVLINEIGEKLNTEHLIWNQKIGQIYSEEFVRITTAEEIVMGDGFESNQSFTNFKIKHITGTIIIEEPLSH